MSLLDGAVAAAKNLGLAWNTDPIKLKPSDELAKVVRRSRDLAAEGN